MKKLICIVFLVYLSIGSGFATSQPYKPLPSVYPDSYSFLKAEGNSCQVATDWCNTVTVVNGKLWTMTRKYCEDTYGRYGREQWSCVQEKSSNNTVDDSLSFMSQSDKNDYYNLQEQLWYKTVSNIQYYISTYINRVNSINNYNTPLTILSIRHTVGIINDKLYEITSSIPADGYMDSYTLKKYQILKFIRYELEIIKNQLQEEEYGVY